MSTSDGRPLKTRPSSRTALAEQRRAERMQSELLPEVRRAAERWAAAIGALLAAAGVAGIASGPDQFRALDAPWGDVGGIVLLVGVVCGVVAMWLASSASMLTLDRILVSGDELRRVEERRFNEARWKLIWARRIAAFAVTALLASAVILWSSPRASTPDQLVQGRTASGQEICGVLGGQGSTAFVAGDDAGTMVRDLDRVRVVARCPRTR